MQAGFVCGELLREIRQADREACGVDLLRLRQMERFLNNVPKQALVQCTPEELTFILNLPPRGLDDA